MWQIIIPKKRINFKKIIILIYCLKCVIECLELNLWAINTLKGKLYYY